MDKLKPLSRLEDSLAKLPSVGRKSAERMAFAMLEMNDEDFLFSLYPNDLIRIQNNKDIVFTRSQKDSDLPEKIATQDILVYYKSTGISSGSITVINNDNSYMISSLGAKTLKSIEKYQVDILGNFYKVKKEKRQLFH